MSVDVNVRFYGVAAFPCKINRLGFDGASSSQCGGQEFDPPLLHHLFQEFTATNSGGRFSFGAYLGREFLVWRRSGAAAISALNIQSEKYVRDEATP